MRTPQEFLNAYAKTIRNLDVEGYVALYDESVRIFDLWDDWSATGLGICRKTAEEWFASLGQEHVVVTFSEIEIHESADLALINGFVRFAAHSADGKQLRFLDERMSVVLKKNSSGQWLVIHQHTSQPVDSQGMKVKMIRASDGAL